MQDKFPILISCPCGINYDAPQFRLVKCPSCGHVWDLRPDMQPIHHSFSKLGIIKEILHEATGTLRYIQEPLLKLVLEVEPDIANYYRALVPKWIVTKPQKYEPHVSVIRKEIPPKMELWGKYEGQEISFKYSSSIRFSEVYGWLNVFSTKLEEIRKEIGLENHSKFTVPLTGFNHCFHMTILNFK